MGEVPDDSHKARVISVVTAQPAQNDAIPVLAPLADLAHSLYDHGIAIQADIVDDAARNLSGGLRLGGANAGVGRFGADLDLQKLLGIDHAKLHVLMAQFYGDSVQSTDIGNAIKVQGWYYPYQQLGLAQFAYEQDFLNDTFNIYLGRTNATGLFARSTYGCEFVSAPNCPYFLPLMTGGLSGFPYVTWGGRIEYRPTTRLYIETGVFEINPQRKSNQGFDWSFNGSTGVTVPFEVGYRTSFKDDNYPRHLQIGGWYNNANYTDPLLNTAGQSRVFQPGAPRTYSGGRAGFYALADQVVYRPDSSQRNLALFASTAEPFDGRETFQSESSLGAVFTGTIANRPQDRLGVMVTYVTFTDKELGYMNDLLIKAGSASRVSDNELMFEVNYDYKLGYGFRFEPNVQYIVNPDISGNTRANRAPGDALVVGIRLAFNMSQALGLPVALPR
ncbi:MAG: carbohydrate porin [Rhizomicrobium sp.]|nr:carbohydrate porin [Rhizomicrobium sp.]